VKLPLATRLVLSYLVVMLVGMSIIGPLAWLAVERLYLDTQSASLLAQAQLIATALEAGSPSYGPPAAYSQSANTLPGIHTHVIDAQGAVLVDLPLPGPISSNAGLSLPQLAQNANNQVSPQELLARPEMIRARAGQAATAIRSLESMAGKRVLYAAAPVKSPDGSIFQIVYLATPLPDDSFSALPDNMRWLLGGVVFAAILLAVGAGLFLARGISQPLQKLAEAARAVASGDLEQSVPEDGSISELAVLGQAFNRMTSHLRQSNLIKNAFISDVTHELRTPLTVIKGTIETLQDGAMHDPAVRGTFLASMSRETNRLIRLVNDLLVLTRADAGALNLQIQPLDLKELIISCCHTLAPLAAQRQVSLVPQAESRTGQGTAWMILADADRMTQVVNNLLDNALRYAPAGSEIRVSLTRSADQVVCQVKDSGPGIAEAHLPFIFERFYRADSARTRGQGGSGLGLSIVRSLVQAHAGQVSAESRPGEGATLTFLIPAAPN
jgi:signal transduction histidine kinase